MNYVILAGGSGTRLWPISRNSKPKQLSQLVGDLSMIEETYHRLGKGKQVFISTNDQFAPLIKKLLPEIPEENYIIEPEKRDNGPAIAFVAAWLSLNHPDEPMVLMPSDHHIRDQRTFLEVMEEAERLISERQVMVNIGIQPTFPNTALGYLEVSKEISRDRGVHVYQFVRQKEKPDYKTAKKFLDEGTYFWNAGYFAWTPTNLINAYKQFAPTIGDYLDELVTDLKNGGEGRQSFSKMEKVSIDYAVIEKIDPKNVVTIRGDFGWADLGSWDQLFEQLSDKTDQDGNLIKANWHGVETRNTLVYGPADKIITTLGVSDLVIVDSDDALLVTPMSRAKDVKKIVELLQEHKLNQHL